MADPASGLPLLTVDMKLPRDPRLFQRDHLTNLRETLRAAAEFHHEKHIPRHFENFASVKYGYAKRSQSTLKRKAKLGLPPLVSGLAARQGRPSTKQVVTTQRKITATSKRSRLILRLPFTGGTGRVRRREGVGLNSQQKTLLRTMAELQAISADEYRAIGKFIEDEYNRRANLPGTSYRVRYR